MYHQACDESDTSFTETGSDLACCILQINQFIYCKQKGIFLMKHFKWKHAVLLGVVIVLLGVYNFYLQIPKVKIYEYAVVLHAEQSDSNIELDDKSLVYGESAVVRIEFRNTSIRNTYYDEGIVMINGTEYHVENTRHYPRSFLARLKHEIKYMAEFIKYNYDIFWFDLENNMNYRIVIQGREDGENIQIHIEKDGMIYYSYK